MLLKAASLGIATAFVPLCLSADGSSASPRADAKQDRTCQAKVSGISSLFGKNGLPVYLASGRGIRWNNEFAFVAGNSLMANEDSPNAAAPKAELIAGVTMSRRGKVSRVIPAPAIDFAAVLSNANDNKSISVLYGADRDTAGRALITISEIKGASFSSDGRWTLNGVIARGQKLLLQEGASTTVPSLRESVFAIGGREVVGGSSRPGILLLRKRDSQWFEQWLPIGETFTPGPVAIARSSDNSISVYFERVPVDSIETGRGIYVLRHSLTGSHKSKLELVKSVPSSAGIMRPRVVHLPNGAQHVFWVEVSRTDVKPIAYIAHAWRTPADTVWRTNSHVLKHGSVAFLIWP